MQTVSTAAANAIAGYRRVFAGRVKIDFNRDGTYADYSKYLESISDSRSLTSDVPDGTRIVTGTSAADGQIQMGGDPDGTGHSLAYNWSPFNASGPLWAQPRVMAPAYAEVGIMTGGTVDAPTFEYVRMLTGRVRIGTMNGDQGTVQLQPVDGSALLKTQVLLPMATNLGHPGLDNRFFIDYILTANGITPGDQDLEDSLNPLIATPYSGTKQDAWTLIQAIAASELAVAFFDETGLFHYWNRNHFKMQLVDYAAKTVTINGITQPIPQVKSTKALKTVTTVEAADSVRNHIQVTYNPRIVLPLDWVWQANSTIGIHSKETKTVWANFDNPIQTLDTTVNVIALGGSTGGHSGYRASTHPDDTGDYVGNLAFTVTAYSQSAKIQIHNPNGHPTYLVAAVNDGAGNPYPSGTAGQPYLWLRGRAVVADPNYASTTDGASGAMAEAFDTASMDPDDGYGEQILTFDGGDWLQDPDTAQMLADDLLSMCNRPTPYFDSLTVVGDPRLQIGDRIELIDTDGMPFDEHVWITGKSSTLSTASGFEQVLDCRLCAGIGGWVLGHPTRSILGSTTILGGVY